MALLAVGLFVIFAFFSPRGIIPHRIYLYIFITLALSMVSLVFSVLPATPSKPKLVALLYCVSYVISFFLVGFARMYFGVHFNWNWVEIAAITHLHMLQSRLYFAFVMTPQDNLFSVFILSFVLFVLLWALVNRMKSRKAKDTPTDQ